MKVLQPVWISERSVLTIHHEQLVQYGGLDGIRDAGMLSSALAKPRNLLAYGGDGIDLASLAASYAFGVARNHPFLDGNKRTALVVSEAFLLLNGLKLIADNDEVFAQFLALAEGKLPEADLADWLREHTTSTA